MSLYGNHVVGERLRTAVVGKSKTKESFAKECDINQIMLKYQRTGAVSHVNRHGADYGFATSMDFSESMRVVKKAQDMFDDLPSSIRSRCGNDPAAFLDFVQDDKNKDELIELGLVEAPLGAVVEAEPEEAAEPPGGPPADPEEPGAQVVT